ncbi:MAG: methyltransferase domain-containing protein [Candidatus Bathyarchaeota archaeon]|nr:methyltransferase domain-containing protein [Candidatus Bathyarchaeum sp.]
MKKSHVFDPRHIEALESKERTAWQNPEEIIPILNLKPSYIAADLGCGTGYFTIPLSRKVKKVYGIDVQNEMLAFLDQKIQKQKIRNIETILAKENKIPLPDESINFLLTVNTLHEFHDRDAILKEIIRVITTQGQVAVIDFKKENMSFGPPNSIRVSKEKSIRLFEKQGLTVLDSHTLRYHYLIVFGKK